MLTEQTSMSTTITANLAEVRSLRYELVDFANQCGLPELTTGDIELTVSEICTNIVEHGYHGSSTEKIELKIFVNSGEVQISIKDQAPQFELPEGISQMPNSPQLRGYGLRLVLELTSEFTLENTGDFNIWTLKFEY